MPINTGEIICPNCGEEFDRQFIKDLINNEEKIISGTIGAKESIKEIVDELKKVGKQGKEINRLYDTLVSLELLLCEVNDIKLAKLKRIVQSSVTTYLSLLNWKSKVKILRMK